MTAQPALPLHMCPMAYILCGLCLARSRCLAQVCIPAMARRARVKLVTCTCGSCPAVSPNVVLFVYSLRATASRPSPMPCPCLSSCTLQQGLASLRHVHMWALPRILAERYHDTVRVQTCSHACDLSSTCAHVPAGLLHLHALSLRFHTARVHTHVTCARWLENSPLTIACRASPMPGRCVHACLARLLMSSLSCIPAFSPNVVCVQDSIFCAILHVINLYKYCKN